MSNLKKARLHSINVDGSIGEDVDVYTSGDSVTLNNGKTLEDVYQNEIGDTSKLNTTNKDLVNAVNENTYDIKTNADNIKDISADLSKNTQNIKTGNIKRLKQPLCANTYWINGYTLENEKNEIDQWANLGLDGIVVTIHLVYNNSVLQPSEDMSDILTAISYAQSKGLEITCIKVHCTETAGTSFLTDYQTAISSLLTTFTGLSTKFIILNERDDIVNSETNDPWITSLISTVKSVGFLCGISLQTTQYYTVSDAILSALDFIGLNCYPIIGYNGKYTTMDDCINALDVCQEKYMLLQLKEKYANKPIIISETGIRNYYVYYANPGAYQYDDINDIANGQTIINYFNAIFEIFNNKIDGIWSWYSIYFPKTVNFFRSWTGGVK